MSDPPNFNMTTPPPGSGSAVPPTLREGDAAEAARDGEFRLPGYRLLGEIGRGGMGTVYLFEQEKPRRRVAIKTMLASATNIELLARFELEAEILARLQHPGIAQIFGAGWVGLTPYIIMEYIDGANLTVYAESIALADKLRVLARTCDAIEHAHQRGVIHRDLKPTNVLVTSDGKPKVLDFGVARLHGEQTLTDSKLTSAGTLLGTVSYMSPEQARGDNHNIDTRSDVYALGVIGYELVAGKLPYVLKGLSLFDALKAIQEAPQTPLPEVDRDLQLIFACALDRDPARRYQGAGEFAADLRRFLRNESIQARPPSWWYQFRKFARRHPLSVSGAAFAIIALVGAAILMSAIAIREREARERSANMTRFFTDMLSRANPALSVGRSVTVRELIDEVADSVGERLAHAPAEQAEVRRTLGETYLSLGFFRRAAKQFEAAVALNGNAREKRAESAELQTRWATALLGLGELANADALAGQVLLTDPQASVQRVALRLQAEVALELGDPRRGARLIDAALGPVAARVEALPPQVDADLASGLRLQARIKSAIGDTAGAAQALERARLLAPDALSDLQAGIAQAELTANLALAGSLLADASKRIGPQHELSLQLEALRDQLSVMLPPAKRLSRRQDLLARAELTLDRGHPLLLSLSVDIWRLQQSLGSGGVALNELLGMYTQVCRNKAKSSRECLATATLLARQLSAQRRFDEAEPLWANALAGASLRFGDAHAAALDVRASYAAHLRDRGQFVEADLEYTSLLKADAEAPAARLKLHRDYAESLRLQQRYGEALAQIEAARALGRQLGGPDPATPFDLQRQRALLLIALGGRDYGVEQLDEAWKGLEALPEHGNLAALSVQMAAALREIGEGALADEWEGRATAL